MALSDLTRALDDLLATDPGSLADGETVVALSRQLSRLSACLTRAVAAFDTSREWNECGAKNASAWLATELRLPPGEARRLVRRGRQLRSLPSTEAAFREGQLTSFHVDAIGALANPVTEDALERDEKLLVGQATTLRFSHFARALRYWDQLADPDGTEAQAEARKTRRDVHLSAGFSGMFLGQMTLDPVSGAIVADELARIEAELFDNDWAEAKDRLGRDPRPEDLRRRPHQRRADALVEMATRSAACPDGARRPAPLFSVYVDYETVEGRILELANGTVLAPGDLVPWLTTADIERAVFLPGKRVEIGKKARLFTGAIRRAIELRDRQCTHPTCEAPAERCQVDHIVPYAYGGLTTQENGRLLCPFHNRLRVQRPPPPGGAWE